MIQTIGIGMFFIFGTLACLKAIRDITKGKQGQKSIERKSTPELLSGSENKNRNLKYFFQLGKRKLELSNEEIDLLRQFTKSKVHEVFDEWIHRMNEIEKSYDTQNDYTRVYERVADSRQKYVQMVDSFSDEELQYVRHVVISDSIIPFSMDSFESSLNRDRAALLNKKSIQHIADQVEQINQRYHKLREEYDGAYLLQVVNRVNKLTTREITSYSIPAIKEELRKLNRRMDILEDEKTLVHKEFRNEQRLIKYLTKNNILEPQDLAAVSESLSIILEKEKWGKNPLVNIQEEKIKWNNDFYRITGYSYSDFFTK